MDTPGGINVGMERIELAGSHSREPDRPFTLVIVGGVAGGMSCAARARRLNESAKVIVLERGPHVSFANCGLPYHVGGEIPDAGSLLVQTPESLRAALNLDVRTGHEVVDIDSGAHEVHVRTQAGEERLHYDALVLAPGARAVPLPVEGLDGPGVRTLRSVEDAVSLKRAVDDGARTAVVLGAGFIGLEAAEVLAERGLAVTVVEAAGQVLPPLEPELASLVSAELERLGVMVRVGVTALRVSQAEAGKVVELSDGAGVQADLIIVAAGVVPDTEAFERAGVECSGRAIVVDDHGRTSLPDVWAVGDAVEATDVVTGGPRPALLAGPANRAGRLVADAIMRPGSARAIPAVVGTAIVRVGNLTAAMTGANRTTLARAGIVHETIHLHPLQHAGYFPGAAPIHLVMHISPDGRILGAQAVGEDGADKRIDVLATAIRVGLSAADLIDLDLAYAPQYGQAKDAVNLAGMVASNVLDSTLRLWHAEDWKQEDVTSLLLDVRTREEYADGHLPGALNVPHTEIRMRLDEVTKAAAGRPVRVICKSGVRSAIAHRILTQHDIESASLSGGMLTLSALLGARAAEILVRN